LNQGLGLVPGCGLSRAFLKLSAARSPVLRSLNTANDGRGQPYPLLVCTFVREENVLHVRIEPKAITSKEIIQESLDRYLLSAVRGNSLL